MFLPQIAKIVFAAPYGHQDIQTLVEKDTRLLYNLGCVKKLEI